MRKMSILLSLLLSVVSTKLIFGKNICSVALSKWNQSILSPYSNHILNKQELHFLNYSIPRVKIEKVVYQGIVDEKFFLDAKRSEKLIDDQGNHIYRRPLPNTDAEKVLLTEPVLFSELAYAWKFINKISGKIEGLPQHLQIQDGLNRNWSIYPTEDQNSLIFESSNDPLLKFKIGSNQFEDSLANSFIAQQFDATLIGKQFKNAHNIKIIIGIGSALTIENVMSAFEQMPDVLLYSFRKLVILPATPFGRNFARCGYAILAKKEITLYPWLSSGLGGSLLDILNHEAGHLLASFLWESSYPPLIWVLAKKIDRTKVTDYGETSLSEDFAEAVSEFSRFGKVSASAHKKRWGILEEIIFKRYPGIQVLGK